MACMYVPVSVCLCVVMLLHVQESASSVELDIYEKRLLLQCAKPDYKLDVSSHDSFLDEYHNVTCNQSTRRPRVYCTISSTA